MTLRILLFSLALIPIIGFSQFSEKEADILRQELSDRINKLRESKGLKPLIFNDTLRKAAEFHSEYMAKNDVLTHDQKRSKYKTPKKRVLAFDGDDFEIVGENALYSTPQEFPLRRNELVELADEMFNSWKNSPGHYANMTEPEYVFGDLGFKANLKKQIVYATQVFGTKGYVVEGQISDDSFGLVKAPDDLSTSLDHSYDFGPQVKVEYEINNSESDYIIIFKAHKIGYQFSQTREDSITLINNMNQLIKQEQERLNSNLDQLKENSHSVDMFPNPTAGKVSFRSNMSSMLNVVVRSPEGKIIDDFDLNTEGYELDMTEYVTGIYLVYFFDQEEIVATKKLVKY